MEGSSFWKKIEGEPIGSLFPCLSPLASKIRGGQLVFMDRERRGRAHFGGVGEV